MIGVEKILFDLLLNHDCVSLSGFGGLVAQRFRAEINPGTNIVRPPSKRISFHEGLTASQYHPNHKKLAARFSLWQLCEIAWYWPLLPR